MKCSLHQVPGTAMTLLGPRPDDVTVLEVSAAEAARNLAVIHDWISAQFQIRCTDSPYTKSHLQGILGDKKIGPTCWFVRDGEEGETRLFYFPYGFKQMMAGPVQTAPHGVGAPNEA